MVRTYELMAVLTPDIPEEEMPGALERIAASITSGGGEVTELITTSPWGRRRLAYPIRKYRDGFYALYHFTLDPARVQEMERDLGLNNQVLRSLVTTYTAPKPPKPKKGAAEAAGTTGEAVPAAAPSGAGMDTDRGLTTGPDGEDLTEPPTAETPAAGPESENEPVPA